MYSSGCSCKELDYKSLLILPLLEACGLWGWNFSGLSFHFVMISCFTWVKWISLWLISTKFQLNFQGLQQKRPSLGFWNKVLQVRKSKTNSRQLLNFPCTEKHGKFIETRRLFFLLNLGIELQIRFFHYLNTLAQKAMPDIALLQRVDESWETGFFYVTTLAHVFPKTCLIIFRI